MDRTKQLDSIQKEAKELFVKKNKDNRDKNLLDKESKKIKINLEDEIIEKTLIK